MKYTMLRSATWAVCILFLTGCKSPYNLSSPKEFPFHVKGLVLEWKTGKPGKMLHGEILEVTDSNLTVLLVEGTYDLQVIPRTDLEKADILVATTSDSPKSFAIWTALLNLMPLGHGFFGILTIPVNLSTSIPLAVDASAGTYRLKFPRDVPWSDLHKFARFPQGIPASINLTSLK